VKVHASALNPIDWKARSGHIPSFLLPKPFVVGFDVSGTIQDIGVGAKKFKKGDAVFGKIKNGSIRGLDQFGGCAEYIAVSEELLTLKPDNVSFEDAASVPLVGLTVIQAFVAGNVRSGQKLLIHAGAGGCGTFAIQYAKHLGCTVATTTSTANVELVRRLGADIVVDYSSQKFEEVLPHDFDFVFDSVSGDVEERSWKVLKRTGVLVSLIPNIHSWEPYVGKTAAPAFSVLGSVWKIAASVFSGPVYKLISTAPNEAQITEIGELMRKGTIKGVVDKVYPLDQYAQAFQHLETGHARGKIVIKIC